MACLIVLASLLATVHAGGTGNCTTGAEGLCPALDSDSAVLLQGKAEKVVAAKQMQGGVAADDDKVSEDAELSNRRRKPKGKCGYASMGKWNKRSQELLDGMPKNENWKCPTREARGVTKNPGECPCPCEQCHQTNACIDSLCEDAGMTATCAKVKSHTHSSAEKACVDDLLKPCEDWKPIVTCYANFTQAWDAEEEQKTAGKGGGKKLLLGQEEPGQEPTMLVDMAARAGAKSSNKMGVQGMDETLDDKCA